MKFQQRYSVKSSIGEFFESETNIYARNQTFFLLKKKKKIAIDYQLTSLTRTKCETKALQNRDFDTHTHAILRENCINIYKRYPRSLLSRFITFSIYKKYFRDIFEKVKYPNFQSLDVRNEGDNIYIYIYSPLPFSFKT